MDRLSNILKQRLEAVQTAQPEHPSADLLAAFIEHTLGPTQRNGVLLHLSMCPACREAVALAAPEIGEQNAQAAHVSRKVAFRLPAAMRWASAAAAIAVAVGIGIIAHEHELEQKPAQAVSSRVAEQKAAQPQLDETLQPKSSTAAPSTSEKSVNGNLGVHDRTVLKKAKPAVAAVPERRFGANLAKQQTRPGRVDQNQPGVVGGIFGGGNPQAFAGRGEISAARSLPAAQVPPPAAMEAPRQTAESVTVESATADATAVPTEPVTIPKAAAGVAGGQPAPRSKISNTVAATGATFRRSFAQSNQIVDWTISTAGKLLRRAQNGVMSVVEPAAGLTVRAVAASGIEVWAGGVQPDISAKQWQQRPALFHSSDAGETWSKVDGPWSAPITRLDLASEESLTVTAEDGTWSTTDAGKSWVKK